FSGETAEPGDISAGTRQTVDYLSRDWILSCHYDNGNRLGRLFGCADRWRICHDNRIDLEFQEFGQQAWDTVRLSLNVAIVNQDVFPLNITQVSQSLPERLDLISRSLRIASP